MSQLLDVNVLIALIWIDHPHHTTALGWLNRHAVSGWATCAITQAGFIRVITQPSFAQGYGCEPATILQAHQMLKSNIAHKKHKFLDLNFGFDAVLSTCKGGLQGHRQVTDAYLLTLAIQNKCKLVTLDSGIGSLLATAAERQKHLFVLN